MNAAVKNPAPQGKGKLILSIVNLKLRALELVKLLTGKISNYD